MGLNVEAIGPTTEPVAADNALCRVTTTDATGTERVYEVSISVDLFGEGHTNGLQGKRVDADAPDEPAGGGVPSRVFEAAGEHFRDRGFEVRH
jgi:hypothetical protein